MKGRAGVAHGDSGEAGQPGEGNSGAGRWRARIGNRPFAETPDARQRQGGGTMAAASGGIEFQAGGGLAENGPRRGRQFAAAEVEQTIGGHHAIVGRIIIIR